MVNMVGVKATLNNNCSLRIDPDAEVIVVNVPKLEGDNVYFNTNSSFCKIEKLVDYKWPKTRNTRWLTVHQTKPYIAYVLHPDFQESSRLSRSAEELDPLKQNIRILNIENQKRILIKPNFTTTIADLAFAYVPLSSGHDDRLAVADRFAHVNIYGFSTSLDNPNNHKAFELLKVTSGVGVPYSEVRLAWCPGYAVDEEDFAKNLAISYDMAIEVYDVGHFIERGCTYIDKEDLDYGSTSVRKLIKESGIDPIISLALSNDLAMLCSATKENRVRFYQLEEDDARLVHTWEPKWTTDGDLSCIFFLDDYNELLKDSESGIWGYIFAGTSNGEITIWESNLWKPIQKVVLSFPDEEPTSNITYAIDLTSHVILAIEEKIGFLLHLEFHDVENSTNSDNKPPIVRQPRIKKITRFQLYNPILSYTVKLTDPSTIEIFWLTQKTIEKCLVDVDSLMADENSESTFLSRFSLSNISQDFDQKRSLMYQNLSLNGGDDESGANESSRRSLPSYEATPPVTLAEIFNNISTISESGTSGLAVGGTTSKNSSGELKTVTGGHPMMNDPMSQRVTSSPTSREVANYLDDEKGQNRNQILKVLKGTLRLDQPSEMNVPPKILNIDPRVQHPVSSMPYEPLPKDLVKEGMIKSLESTLLDRFDLKMDNIKNEMSKITNDIESLRNEVKDPSQLKVINKIVDVLIKKLMHQMNGMFSRGLDEFMTQIRSEITPTINTINQCRNDFNTHCSSVEKQFKQCETQITELRKEVAECCKNQTDILGQLRFQQQQLHSVISPSPTALRHQFMNVTPTPNKQQPFSPMVIFQSEEERRKKAEQEKAIRLQQMWSKIRSNDRKLMIDGICQAFELKDPNLINQICDHFRATKGATFLVDLISHDQALLLSILSTLASADLKEEKWKIPFITTIIPKLDVKSPLTREWLPRFETKLVGRLEEAQKVLGDQARDIPLVLKILSLMRAH